MMAITGTGMRRAQAQRERGFFTAIFTIDEEGEEAKRIHRRNMQQKTREFADPLLSSEARVYDCSVKGGE